MKDSTQLTVCRFLFTVCLFLWTVVPVIFVSNVYMDTAESIAWGFQWQLGYDKHPPLTGWLASIFSSLGPYINFQIFLLGTLMSLVAFWAVWRIASRILSPVKALASVLLLDCALYYNFRNLDLEHFMLS